MHTHTRTHTLALTFLARRRVGFFKGLVLLPLILPLQILTVLVTNLLSLPLWLDRGLAAIRL